MFRRAVSGMMLTMLLFVSIVMLAFNVEPVEGWTGTIYIQSDGSIDPPDAPMVTYDYITYTLTDNITSTAHGIIVERDNIIIEGAGYTVQGPGYQGIWLYGSNVTIKDINIINYSCAIYIGGTSLNNRIVRNNIENNHVGILLEVSSNNRISRNNITNNVYGIILPSSSNNTINNNKIMHSLYGIMFLYNSKYNSVLGNNITNNNCGVWLRETSGNVFSDNKIVHNNYGILYLPLPIFFLIDINNDNSPEKAPGYPNPVYPNPCGNPDFRRALWHTINRTYIISNIWNYSALPMYTLILPQFEEFAHPDIRPRGTLENLTYPYNLTEAAHILNEVGFIDIDGDGWRNFPEELGGDGSNIILKYFIRSDDSKRKALGLWHANQLESIGIKVERVFGDIQTAIQEVVYDKNFSLYTGGWSVGAFPDYLVMWHSYSYWHPEPCYNYDRVNCSTYDYWVNKILEGLEAKKFEEVRYATLKAQEAFNRPDCLGAIPICAPIQYEVGNNNFFNNLIAYTRFSFKLVYSLNNSIYENNIKNNLYGILLHYASSNKIFHNNFINNTQQVHDYSWNYTWFSPSINSWDNGYPSGGNYWSDYTDADLYSGPYQNETGSDGIGDTPYIIDENNVDRYPLMGPFEGLTVKGQNVTVYPSSNICLIFENVTEAGLTTVNETEVGPDPPTGFKLAGKYYDIKTTANYSGIIEIRIAYNDANMTEEEEANLCLMQWNETLQQWIDITTYLDIENNVIYGETTHLSIFTIFTPMLAPPTITATIEIKPDTANLISKGERIIAYIELPEGYDVNDIVASTILLNDTILVDSTAPFVVGDYDEDSVPDLMIRFNGTILSEFILSTGIVYGNVTLTLTGQLINGVSFQGSDIILVSALVGDINVDGKVDITDLSIAALAFGSYPDHPRWNPQADINNDNYIDITDIALTARNFGTTYQP